VAAYLQAVQQVGGQALDNRSPTPATPLRQLGQLSGRQRRLQEAQRESRAKGGGTGER